MAVLGAKGAYFEERADDGEDHDGEQRHDDAAAVLAPYSACSAAVPYHVHAFIADTTGFTMVGGCASISLGGGL